MEIKLPLYDLLNRFLVGLVFIGCVFIINYSWFKPYLKKEYFDALSTGPEILIIICVFAITYEIGLIINRISSVVFEPVLKKMHIIPFNQDYKRFNEIKKEYPIIDTLSREYALSRTSLSLFVMLTVIALCGENKILSIPFIILAFVFLLSLRKYGGRIVELMK